MEKLLTIVVPSYNTEKYINECLPHFFHKDILSKNIEILLVNDGSKDNTLNLLKQYKEKYPNIVRIIDKDNGGHGSVINIGLVNAKGRYFKVVDGDDWVSSDGLIELINILSNTDVDLVINDYQTVHDITKKVTTKRFNMETNKDYTFEELPLDIGLFGLHSITIKKDILLNNNIVVTENCYYEDSEYILYPIPFINTILFSETIVYNYRVGNPNQSISLKNGGKNLNMHKKITQNLIDFYINYSSQVSLEKKHYIEKSVKTRIRTQYGLYLKCKFENDLLEKFEDFDNSLKIKSRYLYDKSNEFPINFLRINFSLFHHLLSKPFQLYLSMRG